MIDQAVNLEEASRMVARLGSCGCSMAITVAYRSPGIEASAARTKSCAALAARNEKGTRPGSAEAMSGSESATDSTHTPATHDQPRPER